MNKVAIYPGTFDPITYGHIDVIKKALKIFDKIIVAVSEVSDKNYLFSLDERISIVNKALFSDLKLNKKKILVISFGSLTTDLCKKYKSTVILRGLRAVSDLSKSSGCIVYFFCLKLEALKLLFLLSDIPQPLDITLKAFQTK